VIRPNPALNHTRRPCWINKDPRCVPVETYCTCLWNEGHACCNYRNANAHPWRKPQLTIVRYFHVLFVFWLNCYCYKKEKVSCGLWFRVGQRKDTNHRLCDWSRPTNHSINLSLSQTALFCSLHLSQITFVMPCHVDDTREPVGLAQNFLNFLNFALGELPSCSNGRNP
jgi:hypothetical protein